MRISDWSSDVCSSDLVSTPELVVASCRAGAIGSFPSINARTPGLFDDWMTRIAGELDAARAAGETPAPMAVNLLTHDSNPRFEPDFAIVRKWEIGRAHVCTPVPNANIVCRLLLETKKTTTHI